MAARLRRGRPCFWRAPMQLHIPQESAHICRHVMAYPFDAFPAQSAGRFHQSRSAKPGRKASRRPRVDSRSQARWLQVLGPQGRWPRHLVEPTRNRLQGSVPKTTASPSAGAVHRQGAHGFRDQGPDPPAARLSTAGLSQDGRARRQPQTGQEPARSTAWSTGAGRREEPRLVAASHTVGILHAPLNGFRWFLANV